MDKERFRTKLDEHLRSRGDIMYSFICELDKYVSPVRNQGDVLGQCSFIVAVAATEMIYRIMELHILPDWTQNYYFSLHDIFDNIYTIYPNIPRAAEKKLDTLGRTGLRVKYVLEYLKNPGLLATSCCHEPRERNLFSIFDEVTDRHQIDSYAKLERRQVLECVKTSPVIAVMLFYRSFDKCKEIIYDGPIENELKIPENDVPCHAVLIVGSVRVKHQSGSAQYVIIQNCQGKRFGSSGFIALKFDELFKEFWLVTKSESTGVVTNKRKYPDSGEQHDKGGTSSRPLQDYASKLQRK